MIHIAAISQIRLDTEDRAYYRRKRAADKTKLEALRCLKRRISDTLYRQLLADAERAQLADAAPEQVGTGPAGHCGLWLSKLGPHPVQLKPEYHLRP
jgi:hypothetical protein